MQPSPPLSSSPSLNAYFDEQNQFIETVAKVSEDLTAQLKPTPSNHEDKDKEEDNDDDDVDDFSFVCNDVDISQISADDIFHNGQIRPIYPLFNRDLVFSGEGSENLENRLSVRSPVKVFIEGPPPTTSESDGIDGIAAGPYCEWSKKAVEASPEVCKKSNSTGFSKIWRFRDFLYRSNSDGRDAFVYLNNPTENPKREEKVVEKTAGESSSEKKTAGEVKVAAGGGKRKGKKGVKGGTTSLSAHEVYMRNRVLREDDRRRSYLPYRPELVGFFTNVNGGLSRNVHPF